MKFPPIRDTEFWSDLLVVLVFAFVKVIAWFR